MTWFCIKWPKKGWYVIKQNNQPTKSVVVSDFEVALFCFFGGAVQKEEDALYTTLYTDHGIIIQVSLNFLVFHTFGNYLIKTYSLSLRKYSYSIQITITKLVSSNSYKFIIICLHIVTWFKAVLPHFGI